MEHYVTLLNLEDADSHCLQLDELFNYDLQPTVLRSILLGYGQTEYAALTVALSTLQENGMLKTYKCEEAVGDILKSSSGKKALRHLWLYGDDKRTETRVCLQTLFTKSCYDREMCYYDIPEDLWLRLEPILPTEGSPRGGRPIGDVRNFLNAVHWMLRTGSPWRALPEKYGSWKTVYSRFRRWQKRGYLAAILKLLTLQADMDHIMIDGTYVHAHKHSAGARHTSGINQALGRSRGGFTSKIHAVVDALGNLLAFTVTAGQYSEYPQASHLLIQYHNTTILADKGYDSRSLIDALHQQGCEAVIPSRRTNHHPRTIDRHLYKERHLIETFFNKIKEYRKIATRYDKLAEVFAAFVCLAASLIWLR